MATQQPTPAIHSRICKVSGENGNSACRRAAATSAASLSWLSIRRRITSKSGSMVMRQNKPIPMCVARQPVVEDKMLDHRRPDRSGEIIASRGQCDRNTAPAQEPMRDVGHHWAEAGRATDPDQSVCEGDLPETRRPCGREIAGRKSPPCRWPAAPLCRSDLQGVPSARRRRQNRTSPW